MAKEKPHVTMSATNTRGGKVETTVDSDGTVTSSSSGDTTGLHQSTKDQTFVDGKLVDER